MAEVLVFMDESDREAWAEIAQFNNDAIVAIRKAKEAKLSPDINLAKELKKMTNLFWQNLIEKYPVLRNKQLNVDELNGTIRCFTSYSELRKK